MNRLMPHAFKLNRRKKQRKNLKAARRAQQKASRNAQEAPKVENNVSP